MGQQVAVSGASGLVGTRLVPSLRQRGHTVHRLVRSKPANDPSSIYWNYETGEIDATRLEGLDVVIHLAGMPLDGRRWTPQVKAAVYASRVKGTTFLSEALRQLRRPPSVLISASATDFYADSPTPVGEAEGRPGAGYVADMCQDWEAAADSAKSAGIRVAQLRIPSVLAASGHSILAAFLPLFRLGLGPVLGTGMQLMCFIALDDLVRACEHIMSCSEISGPVNVLAPEVVTNLRFAKTLGKLLHRPVFVRFPAFALRLAMGEVAGAILAGDTRLKPDKLLQTGFRFAYPDLESALRHELTLQSQCTPTGDPSHN